MYETITIERGERSRYIYIRGKNPEFKIGDNLAYYDCEGETSLGKVMSVNLDEKIDDWVYVFEDGNDYPEEYLIEDSVYVKKEKE